MENISKFDHALNSTSTRHKIEIDIGFGQRGSFALTAALENPDTLIIGVDINDHSFASAEAERRRLAVDNVQFVHAEAFSFLRDRVPDRIIDAFHLYFPTPHIRAIREVNALGAGLTQWLVSRRFLAEVRRTATPDATLRFITDHEPYFKHVQRLAMASRLVEISWSDPLRSNPVDNLVGTGCERQMRRRQRQIYRAQFIISSHRH